MARSTEAALSFLTALSWRMCLWQVLKGGVQTVVWSWIYDSQCLLVGWRWCCLCCFWSFEYFLGKHYFGLCTYLKIQGKEIISQPAVSFQTAVSSTNVLSYQHILEAVENVGLLPHRESFLMSLCSQFSGQEKWCWLTHSISVVFDAILL